MKRLLFLLLLLLNLLFFSAVLAQDAAPTPDPTAESDETPSPLPTPFQIARPEPSAVYEAEGVTLTLYFERLKQGRAGLLHLSGAGVSSARARFLDQLVDFFPADDGFYALISTSMEQAVREYPLVAFANYADGSQVQVDAVVTMDLGGFLAEDIEVPADRAYLIEPEVERGEFARLDAVFENSAPTPYWAAAGETFSYPVTNALSSTFGSVRTFNGTVPTRHTGWDFQAATGTPVVAAASGVVAFAGRLDIRGSHVIIDHGAGVFTGYSHFSQTHVTRGQEVVQGQIIGMTGNTGRSSGPHLHWEVTVNGEWVDAVDFTGMWLP